MTPMAGVSATLANLSLSHGVPLSTLKLNARILRELGLIAISDSSVLLTESGFETLSLLELSGIRTRALGNLECCGEVLT